MRIGTLKPFEIRKLLEQARKVIVTLIPVSGMSHIYLLPGRCPLGRPFAKKFGGAGTFAPVIFSIL